MQSLRSSINLNKEYKIIVHPQNNIIILNRTLIPMPKSSDETSKDLYKFLENSWIDSVKTLIILLLSAI